MIYFFFTRVCSLVNELSLDCARLVSPAILHAFCYKDTFILYEPFSGYTFQNQYRILKYP